MSPKQPSDGSGPLSQRALLGLAFMILTACGSAGPAQQTYPTLGAPPPSETCAGLDAAVQAAVDAAGVADAEAERLERLPYLRLSRLLASFQADLDTPEKRMAWLDRAGALDHQARVGELASLPPAARTMLPPDTIDRLATCRTQQTQTLLDAWVDTAQRVRRARVPDRYAAAARTLGLYPLTAAGVTIGIARWQRDTLERFEQLPEESITAGQWTVWGHHGSPQSTAGLFPLPTDALALPVVSDSVVETLAHAHAPIIVIDTATSDDLPGHPIWQRTEGSGLRPGVDTAVPAMFVRTAITRFAGRPRLQLVYTIWFGARTATGWFDPYAGRLDGLIWRVTLDAQGQPLLYDSIHACGCYHLFFPVPPVQRVAVAADADGEEAPFTIGPAPVLREGERIVLHVQAGAHYLTHIGTDVPVSSERRYWSLVLPQDGVPDAALRQLPVPGVPGNRRSLFGDNGLIAGTDRLERFYLWPMGIASAGAMRQWGHHATAFVGRRHFDDPFLFDAAFVMNHERSSAGGVQ